MIWETPRLLAREMSLADLDFIAAMLADPEVMRHYPKVYSREEAVAWIERQLERYRRHGHGLWLILDRESEEPVGQVGLLRQLVDGLQEPEVAYLIHRPFWRMGYAFEAASATHDRAFREGHDSVISLIRPGNTPSRAVARKLGMAPERETVFAGLPHLLFRATRPGV